MTDRSALPSPRLTTRWVRADRMPARKRFGRYSVIIDASYHFGGGLSAIRVAYVRDHVFLRDTLSSLPFVPRAVKSIYRGQVRLAFMMATEAWSVLTALDAASEAWALYLKNVAEHSQ